MKIRKLIVNDHTIFGSVVIDLFGKSRKHSKKEEQENDIDVKFDPKKDGNHFTFIIGENGVGKSTFIKTIIHYVNFNYRYQDNIFVRWRNYYAGTEKYNTMDRFSGAEASLNQYGIRRKMADNPQRGFHSILAEHNAQVLFIGNHIELPIIHHSPDFRNFNYTSRINTTKSLFIRALLQFNGTGHIDALNKLLFGDKFVHWRYHFGLNTAYAVPPNENQPHYEVALRKEQNLDMITFLELVNKIKTTDHDTLDEDNLNSSELFLFRQIYENGAFFKLFYDSYWLFGRQDYSVRTFIDNLKGSIVFQKIADFLDNTVEVIDPRVSLVKASEETMKSWKSLMGEKDQLTVFDALFINFLESVNLIRFEITCNEIPLEQMSSGEQTMIRLFSYFSDTPQPAYNENLLVFVDEPENSLHPKWQHDYLDRFRIIAEDVYGFKHSHFIFATHSPLIVMKVGTTKDVKANVLHFFKDKNEKFTSEQIHDIQSYSIESVLLDEFSVSYRSAAKEHELKAALEKKLSEDPIDAIPLYFETQNKIEELYKEIR